MTSRRRDDNWIDGLRGVASFIVVTGHLLTAFAEWLHSPALSEGGPVFIFQYPLLRLCVSGRAAVCMFFIITGYVNSIGPIRNLRNGAVGTAFANLSKSAFMRTGRLVLPTAVVVFIYWVNFELGLFSLAKLCDSRWISFWLRNPEPTVQQALWRLSRAEVEYWVTGEPVYAATLWSIPYFLHGSMMVYVTLLATAFVKPPAQRLIIVGLWAISWCGGQAIEHTNIFFGLFMAQIITTVRSSSPTSTPTLLPSSPIPGSPEPLLARPLLDQTLVQKVKRVLPGLAIFLGLIGCSYPERDSTWSTWSFVMDRTLTTFAPSGYDLNRYWVSVGASLLFAGIHFSPGAQRLLSSPVFNFLGRCSFPVYLLHDQVMRTILVWMIYGGAEVVVEETDYNGEGNVRPLQRGGPLTFCIAIPVFYLCLYFIAWQWTLHVDPLFACLVTWIKRKAWREDSELLPSRGPSHSEKVSDLV